MIFITELVKKLRYFSVDHTISSGIGHPYNTVISFSTS